MNEQWSRWYRALVVTGALSMSCGTGEEPESEPPRDPPQELKEQPGDAGQPPDAGVEDAGSQVDAGERPDAGELPDTGPGCGWGCPP